jgi:hypothetical protein
MKNVRSIGRFDILTYISFNITTSSFFVTVIASRYMCMDVVPVCTIHYRCGICQQLDLIPLFISDQF